MTIRMDVHHRLSDESGAYSGATADVFDVGGIAYKVFRVYGVASPERARDRFESQCEAYRRAAADPWLRLHAATFYGSASIEDIINEDGESIGEQYLLDCCCCMELLSGNEKKLSMCDVRKSSEHLQEAKRRFSEAGIDLSDSSVFNGEDRERFKLIDFGLTHW
jgi:hypothetical protein